MLSMDFLQLNNWILLSDNRKEEILKSFEGYRGHNFVLKNIETFSTNKMNFTTGIFEFRGNEYIFIPGSKVKLGWSEIEEQDKYIIAAIKKELDIACYSKEIEVFKYLKEVFSPLRECEIAPMLVERNVQKVVNENGELVNYYKVIEDMGKQGFSVLTEDEWEYLCGGGTRRIFSTHIDEKLLEDICNNKKYFYHNNFEKLNQFGLYIAYDPYMYEIVDAPCYVKGGDGGGASHGGYYILGILPISPYYRDEEMIETTRIDGLFEWDVFVRKVLRI